MTFNLTFIDNKYHDWINTLFSGRYDLQVIRKELIPLLANDDSVKFVIKKGSSYMCIVTEKLKFLDIIYYIAPGKSYAEFLSAYGATLEKSFFPYTYMDCFEKLEVKTFPEYTAFHSNLKNANTLEPPVDEKTTLEDAKIKGLNNYQELKQRFESSKWSMKDYLIHYNNLDTEPFVEALENLAEYYFKRNVDVFKDAVSGKYSE